MTQPRMFTYFDAVESLNDFMTASVSPSPSIVRRAVQTAYREIISTRDWHCLVRNGRIQLHAAYTTGTVAYDNATRAVTLTNGTWPTWAQDASIRIGDCVSDVESRDSDTALTLDATLNPGADVAAGTAFTIYQRYYVLPTDFATLIGVRGSSLWGLAECIGTEELFTLDQYNDTTGDTLYYAVGPVQDLYGSLGIYPWPPSDTDEPLDITYKRRPRDIRYSGHDAADFQGTISVTASSATVTGSGTAFAATHVGSILRIGTSTTARPTGIEGGSQGSSPGAEERSIVAFTDTTHLTLDAAVATDRSGVKYVVTDPIDLDISLFDAFTRNAEKQLAFSYNLDHKADIAAAAEAALFAAKCADGRDAQRTVAGVAHPIYLRLRDRQA